MSDKTTIKYRVGAGGSTPLWETKLSQFPNGDMLYMERACVVETGEWLPAEKVMHPADRCRLPVVTRQEAFEKFPICFPDLLLKKLEKAQEYANKNRGFWHVYRSELSMAMRWGLPGEEPNAESAKIVAAEIQRFLDNPKYKPEGPSIEALVVLADQQHKALMDVKVWVAFLARDAGTDRMKETMESFPKIADKIEKAQTAHRELSQKPKILNYEYEESEPEITNEQLANNIEKELRCATGRKLSPELARKIRLAEDEAVRTGQLVKESIQGPIKYEYPSFVWNEQEKDSTTLIVGGIRYTMFVHEDKWIGAWSNKDGDIGGSVRLEGVEQWDTREEAQQACSECIRRRHKNEGTAT